MQQLDASITHITVFTDRARVTRQGRISLAAGTDVVSIGGLAAGLLPESVRVSGRGSGVRILGVDVTTVFLAETPESALAELQNQIEDLEEQDRALQDRDSTLTARGAYLETLRQSGAEQLARGLAFGRTTLEQSTQLADYLTQAETEIATGHREIASKRRKLAREIEAAKNRLSQIRPPVPQERRSVQIQVEATAATELDLELSYIVYAAQWEAIYDLRVVDAVVELSYLAHVRQSTGEDWSGVALSLSTARPAVTTTIPELSPWYVDVFRPAPPMPVRAAAPALKMARMRDESEPAAILAEPAPVAYAMATVEREGAAVRYHIGGSSDIPSDGEPHRVTVTALEFKAQLDYVTAPKLMQEAYLRAKVGNTSDVVLLPGTASIFHGDEFVGTTALELIAPGEEFELQLGTDDRLKVERELIGRNVAKTFIGNVRRTQISYRTKLTNLLDTPAQVTLLDQVPLSRHEDVKIKLQEATPAPTEQSELNELRWALTILPQQTREVVLSFTVEHPRDVTIVGLNI